jgi:hypothetical protein
MLYVQYSNGGMFILSKGDFHGLVTEQEKTVLQTLQYLWISLKYEFVKVCILLNFSAVLSCSEFE